MEWRKGVLVCAAPDILYAEDSDGDGSADVQRVLFTGFDTGNYQARVNGLAWGLDNWVHGANGLFGGSIRSASTGESVEIGGRDFRMRPDAGLLEPESGLSQQGLARDDWGEWFGNENWALLRHYPLPERYVRRNPHVAAPNPRVDVPSGPEPNRLYPRSRTLERFNDPHMADVTTSACGPAIYRDDLLGEGFRGNAFACEPVHNLVRRFRLERRGVTFAGVKEPAGEPAELLASEDSWFRPVQALTGPDGALWVVDMYRFVIEHPRWIPPGRLASLDVRAGDDRGRIYRVYPRGAAPRKVEDFRALGARELAARVDHPNGAVRDLAHRELHHRGDETAAPALTAIAEGSARPEARAQALCALDGLGALADAVILRALGDPHPGVRRQAVRLAEGRLGSSVELADGVRALAADPEVTVRYQVALSSGEGGFFRGQGHAVGPDLAAMKQKDPEAVFTAVLDPSAAFEEKFAAYAVETRDGRVVSGLIAAETATTLIVRQAGGLEEAVLRKDVARLARDGRSFMTEGLEEGLSAQALADVIAHVLTGPRLLGSAPPEEQAAARAELEAQGPSGLDQVLEAYDTFLQPSWLGRVPMRYCRQNDGRGKVRWTTRPVPGDLAPGSYHAFRLPIAVGLCSQPAGKFTLSVNGAEALELDVSLEDASWADPRGRARASYTVLERTAEDSAGWLALEVRADLLEPGRPAVLEVAGSAAGSERWFGVLVPGP